MKISEEELVTKSVPSIYHMPISEVITGVKAEIEADDISVFTEEGRNTSMVTRVVLTAKVQEQDTMKT